MPLPAPPFDRPLPLVGMVHLGALPGAPAHTSMAEVLERARADARALVRGGVDGIAVENFGDLPFHPERVPPETVAAMTLAVRAVVEEAGPDGPLVGVNVLRNDARAALGIAAATGARFIRVNVHAGRMDTDQGPLVGRAWETLRVREALPGRPAILADVFVKHATPPAGARIRDAARDLVDRSGADGVIVSGSGTGASTPLERVVEVREAIPGAPVWIGSGVTPHDVGELGRVADGLIVGSWLKEEGRLDAPVDPDRVRALMDEVAVIRSERS